MVVMKFGGSSLTDGSSLKRIAEIIRGNSFSRRVVVLSAVGGVTDTLIRAMDTALQDETSISDSVASIRHLHEAILTEGIVDSAIRQSVSKELDGLFSRLRRLLKGAAYTGEVTPRTCDHILSMGERMSVHLMAGCLRSMGVPSEAVESDQIGMLAAGPWGNGTIQTETVRKQIPLFFHPLFQKGVVPVITGFFGQDEDGDPLTFGRGGSDYSAAVLADALKAERLEVWKDVDGFLSGSPEMVDGGQMLDTLSYDEAAELAHFGATILHPRTVEPLLARKIPILVRNTFKPDSPGTWIREQGTPRQGVVKSVTFDRNVAMLRVHGADVGYAVGLLANLVSELSRTGINIRSVMTSQTCINILLNQTDLAQGFKYIRSLGLGSVDTVEAVDNINLVAVVGDGLARSEGLVARVINVLIHEGIHVELIVSGASRVAAYFLVRQEKLKQTVKLVHDTFFPSQELRDELIPSGEGKSSWPRHIRRSMRRSESGKLLF